VAAIDRVLQGRRERLHVRLPARRGDLVARLRRAGTVVEERYEDGEIVVTALVSAKLAGQVRKLLLADTASAAETRL
jgi:50S ribosomal subunit-associated GTPase HflX